MLMNLISGLHDKLDAKIQKALEVTKKDAREKIQADFKNLIRKIKEVHSRLAMEIDKVGT